MRIGKLVQRHIPAIFEYCETKGSSAFSRLQDSNFSKETFDIYFPFCRPVAQISREDQVRYYQHVYTVFKIPVRVTSQWFNPPTSNSLPLFQAFLKKCGIPLDESIELVSVLPRNSSNERKARGCYKSSAIGNGQNAVIRYILGQLGEEPFSATHWEQVKADFGHHCAYCGTDGKLIMDHVIPINRAALGEHKLGNLAPACQSCNAKKSGKDFREFLKDSPTRIAAIEAHMAKHSYSPLGNHKMLKSILETAHADIRHLADRYVTLIDAMLQDERTP